ncbi:CDP-alcohol phosphatidyltransferase family protein [Patescibacteria group bacterium]|nr:CDP-alcohol phosphatidyltransferase family protein [Patescibacteria group bacterium]MBU1074754.1 CDP-alcohol phosphatidyltransferase family protein [Patescibacteria group bacterium]MBU1952541.1 CDP-alcohol phosphatidyltransferase family protein [Patescibacteria group bacterium]MBU2235592.1 CDP-alcohol phosphatidyltransferase family protein [Patescibacteria group bacterium]
MIKEFLNPDQLTLGLGKLAAKISPQPNVWTIVSLLPAIIGIYLIARENILWGIIMFILAGVMDAIDGAVARSQNRTTYLGAFLDGIADRFVDFLLIFSFLFLDLPDFFMPISWWIVIAAYFALMPTFIVAYANHRRAVPDPTEKVIWRILHRTEMYPLFVIALIVAMFSLTWAMYIIIFTITLSVVTTFQTIYMTAKKSKNYPQN